MSRIIKPGPGLCVAFCNECTERSAEIEGTVPFYCSERARPTAESSTLAFLF